MSSSPAPPSSRPGLERRVIVAIAGAAVLIAAQCLAAVASVGRFAYDECFHAYVAEWIATHGAIPNVIPDLYGGFFYYYQPLLHLIGAASFALFGPTALHVLPVVLWTVTGFVLLWGGRGVVPSEARAWATGLFVLNGSLAVFGMQLYVEGLTALVFTGIAAAWVGWRAAPGIRGAIGLGVLLGLGLLTKFTGWMPFAVLAAVAVGFAAAGRRAHAVQVLCALGVATLIVLPWLVRNQLLFGSAFYPAFAPDLDRAFYELNRHRNTMPAAMLLARIQSLVGYPLLGMVIASLILTVVRRRWSIGMDLVAMALAGAAATTLTPMAAPRHFVPFVPMLALGASWVVFEGLSGRRALALAVSALVLVSAIVVATSRGDLRRAAGLPPPVGEAIETVARVVPERATVLSLWTYDTFYHARRPATWPNPWGQQRRPLELFYERDPLRLLSLLHRDRIDYVLAPVGAAPAPFDSGNYPTTLLTGLEALMRAGAVRPVWNSSRFVLLRVSPADSLATPPPPAARE